MRISEGISFMIDMASLNGYPRMAEVVSQYPGMAIFRRFARLNAQNLLYMQSEISQLGLELDLIALQDSQSNDPKRRSFHTYVHYLKTATGPDSLQWQKIMEMRGRLKEYSTLHGVMAVPHVSSLITAGCQMRPYFNTPNCTS
jgi:hypothetical protein